MSIPESQLITWSHQGAVASASATYASIRAALGRYDGWPNGMDYEVFLQGSYKNDTNIRSDSDVDVVIKLNSTFRYDLVQLTEVEKSFFKSCHPNAQYTWQDFQFHVLRALRGYYGATLVHEGSKSLKVEGGSGRLAADAVVCLQYRKYLRFINLHNQNYIEGMTFYMPNEFRWVVNYPKLHYDNGVAKNSEYATNGWFKRTVRIYKNARTYLINNHMITDNLAPSYFIECLLHNVQNREFGTRYQDTFYNPLYWLASVDLNQFVCQNGQLRLFGELPEQWSTTNGWQFILALFRLWNEWR